MAAVTLLSEAVRGATTRTFTVPNGNPRHIKVSMVSSVYPTNASLGFTLTGERSFDGGVNFQPDFGGTGQGGAFGQPTKGGGTNDGLFVQTVQFDGVGSVYRLTATPTPGPFSWGLTAEDLPT